MNDNNLEPNWKNQIAQAEALLKKEGADEVRRHARVSTRNRHYCNSCFCCACIFVLNLHGETVWR